MSPVKKFLVMLPGLFIVIQFIRPDKNTSNQQPATDISKLFPVSDSLETVLQAACYDCHSNNTKYPWYTNVQPMGWLMAKHIREGKEDLNFNEFGGYSKRRQVSKLKAIGSSIRNGTMPLSSYTLLHREARLTGPAKMMVIKWATDIADSIQAVN